MNDKSTQKLQRQKFVLWIQKGLICVICMVISGCSSAPAQPPPPPHHYEPPTVLRHKNNIPKAPTRPTTEERLRAVARHWSGTPHRLGGTSRQGIDCSGFVQRIYRDLFKIRLPRTTAQQARTGATISKKALRPGDLVFFHPPHKIRHVGIYLGNGEFVHASTSKGVTVSQLNNPYWRKAYWKAKRVKRNMT